MPITLTLLTLALQSAPPLENLAMLHQQMQAASDRELRPLDPRLRLNACPDPVDISTGPRTVIATCASVGWRVHGVPMQSVSGVDAPEGAIIRRGDPVTLRMPGRGFSVTLRAVALEDGALGTRIRVRRTSGPASALIAIVTGPGEARPAS
jgi:hypothetical protein